MKENEEKPSEECDIKDTKEYKIAAGNGIMNLPNKLTISRMIMIPLFVVFFYVPFTGHYFVSLIIFIAAALTDLFDGKIARKYNLVTNLGKFLDPIADKALSSTAFIIFLTVPSVFNGNLGGGNWPVIAAGCGVAIIICREVIVSGFRTVAASEGIVIAADIFGKYKTTFQDISIGVLLGGLGFTELYNSYGGDILKYISLGINYIGLAVFVVAVVLTIISGINYIVKNIDVLKR